MKLIIPYIIAVAVTVAGSGAIYYYVNAIPTYTVKVHVLGVGGIISAEPQISVNSPQGNDLTLQLRSENSLKLTAIPNPGWRLSSWGGDLQGVINPLTIIVTKDMSITATFVES